MAIKSANGTAHRKRVIVGIISIVAAVVVISGWMLRRGPVLVRAEKVVRQEIANTISTNGKIEPVNNFEAHSPAPATVRRIFVHEGDRVKRGQLLVQLDDGDARAQAAKAQAELRAAEANMNSVASGGTQEEVLTLQSELTKAQADRDAAQRNLQAVKRLQQNGAASPAEVQEAQGQLTKTEAQLQLLRSRQTKRFSDPEIAKVQAAADQARAALSAAQGLLNNSNIRAPFAGTVYQLPVKTGSYVNSGALLIQMADLDRLQVRAFVDEPEIGRLARDQKVQVSWDAIPNRIWEGSVIRVPTVVTTLGTRSVGEITCEIPNTDHKLLPNVNVNVTIVTARHDNVATVSRESVHNIDGKRYVYQISHDKLTAQEVSTGLSSLTRIEVTSGVADGTEVARGAINAQPLRNGMEVKVVQR
ncbi:MAG TPA: efflux RND transporter periplasmic adaptor subunit [Verrucomicrobiae bacterium]|jgi:HlyD family secretion protein|nr:efflux RND transporter periplasmic adaptor subunit [Verrucomicrobiae bacterium]